MWIESRVTLLYFHDPPFPTSRLPLHPLTLRVKYDNHSSKMVPSSSRGSTARPQGLQLAHAQKGIQTPLIDT